MGKFIVLSFLVLGVVFYEMSGGSDFEPEFRAPAQVASVALEPAPSTAAQPEVTRANTGSLIQISAPAPTTATPARQTLATPLPAGEVIITPAPDAEPAEIMEATVADALTDARDVRAVDGDWVNMRSGPSTSYDVLETLPRGTEAEVIEVDASGWARIRISNTGQEGWMAERLLSDI